MEKSNTKAFTLIELLVVVLIIGILAAIAVPQYKKAVEKSRVESVFPALTSIYKAAQVYFLENGTWPAQEKQLTISIPPVPKPIHGLTKTGTEWFKIVSTKIDFRFIYYWTDDFLSEIIFVGIVKPANSANVEFVCATKEDQNWCKKMGFTKTASYTKGDFTSAPLGTVYVKE